MRFPESVNSTLLQWWLKLETAPAFWTPNCWGNRALLVTSNCKTITDVWIAYTLEVTKKGNHITVTNNANKL